MKRRGAFYFVIAFAPDWETNSTPVYGPFTREQAFRHKDFWEPIPGWTMEVVRVVST